MARHLFEKGHPGYFEGKKVLFSKFAEPWDLFITGQITQGEAAKRVGVSRPTFVKWGNAIILNGGFDEKLKFIIYDDV